MTELLTAAQMRAIEAAAIASGAVTGLELMERAGRGVVEAVLAEWPEFALAPHRAVVLCGPGNNGGDGFVVARLLQERGWDVAVLAFPQSDRTPADARTNRLRMPAGVRVLACDPDSEQPSFSDRAVELLWSEPYTDMLLVDALFGIGLARAADVVSFVAQEVNCWADDRPEDRLRVVAIDLPSGLCADSGRFIGSPEWRNPPAIRADLTVTFHAPKPGHLLASGPDLCGKLHVADIGLPPMWWRQQAVGLTVPFARSLRKGGGQAGLAGAHKYTHGHALILSGPATRTGAARLAARGALRIGAGVVTVGAPAGALAEHAARLDAVMLREVADDEALRGVLEDRRINALCLGPGLGLDARAAGLVGAALGVPVPGLTRDLSSGGASGGGEAHAFGVSPGGTGGPGSSPGREHRDQRPTVLDADALTLLSRDPALFGALHARCVLTPHAGEFARLFPDIAAKLAEPATKGPAYSKVDATREAAARSGCVVLYKGPDTVIADPSGRAAINSAHYDRAAPWLATAGSGDVLAGFITGLMARGFEPFDAACTAAWLHVECARAFGPGLIAEDLPEMLPRVFRELGL